MRKNDHKDRFLIRVHPCSSVTKFGTTESIKKLRNLCRLLDNTEQGPYATRHWRKSSACTGLSKEACQPYLHPHANVKSLAAVLLLVMVSPSSQSWDNRNTSYPCRATGASPVSLPSVFSGGLQSLVYSLADSDRPFGFLFPKLRETPQPPRLRMGPRRRWPERFGTGVVSFVVPQCMCRGCFPLRWAAVVGSG